MDKRNGNIMTAALAVYLDEQLGRKVTKPMAVAPTPRQMGRRPPKVGRNEPCPCGSGVKFKKCCLNMHA